MEGVRVFSPDEWLPSGLDATSYAATDLKNCLEGLACHLFGNNYVVSSWDCSILLVIDYLS